MPSWVIDDSKQNNAIKKLSKESDRGAAIIAGGFVEHRLSRKLQIFLRSDDEKETKEMFRSSGPLGSFAAKIRLGFLLRLYGKRAMNELNTIKDIRNFFAHEIDAVNFSENQKILALCKNLTLVEGYHRHIDEHEKYKEHPFMCFYQNMKHPKELLDRARDRYLETCGIFVSTFGMGAHHVFAPIHGDDRPAWPKISWLESLQ